MHDTDAAAPAVEVLRAFGGGEARPRPLAGGRGLTWRAGDLVLRPHDGPAVTDWRSAVLATLPHTAEFRTPRPVAARDGGWRVGSWEAWEWVPGAADEHRVEDVLRAGAAFHRAVAHLDRPAFLDEGDETVAPGDAWRRADRIAWGEAPVLHDPTLQRLGAAFRPVRSSSQLVHGDLLGNVLFTEGQPPTIIDWPPTWRPAGTGLAIAAIDAVCWHGVPTDRLAPLGAGIPEWRQLLVRALAFRVATLHLLGAWDGAAVVRHRPVVDAVA